MIEPTRLKRWPNPGDLLIPRLSRFNINTHAWKGPFIGAGIVDIDAGEVLIVLCRALNPNQDSQEFGFDVILKKKWERTWWMALRSRGEFVWINESQMDSMYDVQHANQCHVT